MKTEADNRIGRAKLTLYADAVVKESRMAAAWRVYLSRALDKSK